METSMDRLRRDVTADKIFLVQLVDGKRLDYPLTQEHPWHVEGQPARMSWSRNARCFLFEEKGYLPVMAVLNAILSTGYKGPVSFELFSRTMNEAGSHVPDSHAKRGIESWKRILRHLELGVVGKVATADSKATSVQHTLNSANCTS